LRELPEKKPVHGNNRSCRFCPGHQNNKKLGNISVLAENINDAGNIFAHRISDN
jgi:hypothetical protein